MNPKLITLQAALEADAEICRLGRESDLNPGDPAAGTAYIRYLCIFRHRWLVNHPTDQFVAVPIGTMIVSSYSLRLVWRIYDPGWDHETNKVQGFKDVYGEPSVWNVPNEQYGSVNRIGLSTTSALCLVRQLNESLRALKGT